MPSTFSQSFKVVNGVPAVEPLSFLNVFSQAHSSNPMNATISRLAMSEEDILKVHRTLRDMGQGRFINLSRSFPVSATALALYAGDGIVAKVIGERELSHFNDIIYHVPSIRKEVVEGRDERFHIRFYPWIPPGNVTQDTVNGFKDTLLRRYGLGFNPGDAYPKNVHTLPDRSGTLVGIDSHMYHEAKTGRTISNRELSAWHSYMHALYPIYAVGNVAPQNENTNFQPVSLHNPSAGLISYDDYLSGSADPALDNLAANP